MTLYSLKSTNIELTEAIKQYIEQKIVSLERLTVDFEPAAELSVEVGKTTQHHHKGPFFHAEMMLTIPGQVLRAEEDRENLYEAIDAVKDEMKRQVTDYKNRLRDKAFQPRPGKE